MRIIPAVDLIDGKCVRLTKGDYNTKKIYNENPLEVAKQFEDEGMQYIHIVDLDGAKSNQIINHKALENIAKNTSLKIDFGGGIKTEKDVVLAFDIGASQITIGSIAVQNRLLFLEWVQKYGAERIILGADVKERQIASNGWLQSSSIDVIDFINDYEKEGLIYTVCTDVAKDGMLEGVSELLYQDIVENSNIKLIASGGLSSIDDIELLKKIGCEAVIIGKAIYENKISFEELRKYLC